MIDSFLNFYSLAYQPALAKISIMFLYPYIFLFLYFNLFLHNHSIFSKICYRLFYLIYQYFYFFSSTFTISYNSLSFAISIASFTSAVNVEAECFNLVFLQNSLLIFTFAHRTFSHFHPSVYIISQSFQAI